MIQEVAVIALLVMAACVALSKFITRPRTTSTTQTRRFPPCFMSERAELGGWGKLQVQGSFQEAHMLMVLRADFFDPPCFFCPRPQSHGPVGSLFQRSQKGSPKVQLARLFLCVRHFARVTAPSGRRSVSGHALLPVLLMAWAVFGSRRRHQHGGVFLRYLLGLVQMEATRQAQKLICRFLHLDRPVADSRADGPREPAFSQAFPCV